MNYRYTSVLALGVILLFAIQPALAATGQAHDNATTYFNLGEIAIGNGQLADAVSDFDLALAENTTLINQSDALMYLYKDKAGALADLGKYSEALKTVNAGLLQFRNSSGLWNNKGYILYLQGNYLDAADAYTNALSIDPTYVKGWINKGNALLKAGRYGDAADSFRRALALDPANSDATAGLAEANKQAGLSPLTLAIAAIVVVLAALAVWYVKFRKPGQQDSGRTKKRT